MRQLGVLPVRITDLDPADLGTADAALFGTGDNGLDYVIKTVEKTPLAPAAEYVCHHIADACGIPTPQFDIVLLHDGTEAFGSVWDATAVRERSALQQILTLQAHKSIGHNIARIFTLDMFVHNVDRHGANYLCVAGKTPGHALKAFDFSRAFVVNGWPLPGMPMNPSSNTIVTIRAIARARGFDVDAAQDLLKRIEGLAFSWFKALMESMPKAWLERSVRAKIMKWWASERADRIQSIRNGLKNGSLF